MTPAAELKGEMAVIIASLKSFVFSEIAKVESKNQEKFSSATKMTFPCARTQ